MGLRSARASDTYILTHERAPRICIHKRIATGRERKLKEIEDKELEMRANATKMAESSAEVETLRLTLAVREKEMLEREQAMAEKEASADRNAKRSAPCFVLFFFWKCCIV